LNATSALGVFAQVKCGASLRPPLQWSNNITHVAFTHPYILTLNDEFITVHRSVHNAPSICVLIIKDKSTFISDRLPLLSAWPMSRYSALPTFG